MIQWARIMKQNSIILRRGEIGIMEKKATNLADLRKDWCYVVPFQCQISSRYSSFPHSSRWIKNSIRISETSNLCQLTVVILVYDIILILLKTNKFEYIYIFIRYCELHDRYVIYIIYFLFIFWQRNKIFEIKITNK